MRVKTHIGCLKLPVNDRERAIIACEVMGLKEEFALAYLKSEGFEMSPGHYYRTKGQLEGTIDKRLFEIAKKGFVRQHMQRIQQLEHVEREHWRNYTREKDSYKRSKILEMITNMQPLMSAFYEATKEVMETGQHSGQDSVDISNIGAEATTSQ